MGCKLAVTHDGSFHPDDVFSGALLKRVFPEIEIRRTRDKLVIDQADIVFDVGGMYDPTLKRFDHHQLGAPVREDGLPYSAFGLIWRQFGEQFCGSREVANIIDQRLVREIDADDNGVVASRDANNRVKFVDLIYNLNPLPGSSESFDEQYFEAVKLAGKILDRMVAVKRSKLETLRYVEGVYSQSFDKRFVVLDRPGDYDQLIAQFKDVLYFVSPGNTGSTWRLEAARLDSDEFTARRQLPARWAGLEGIELASETGIDDAIFCHKSRHLIITKSKQSILKLLDKLIEQEENINV